MYNANACVTLVPRYVSIVYSSHQRAVAVVASAAKYGRNKAPFLKESLVNPRLPESALVGQSLLNIWGSQASDLTSKRGDFLYILFVFFVGGEVHSHDIMWPHWTGVWKRFWRTQRAFEIQRFLRAGMNVQEVERDGSPRALGWKWWLMRWLMRWLMMGSWRNPGSIMDEKFYVRLFIVFFFSDEHTTLYIYKPAYSI